MEQLGGIHHITAMCGDAQRNVNFYVHGLGQRMVKRTVNFEDPNTYHLYYGDEQARAGTILTFFPWPHVAPGVRGLREVASFAWRAATRDQSDWENRLADYGARQAEPEERFGETVLPFQDPDGMWFELILEDAQGGSGDESSSRVAPPVSNEKVSREAPALGKFHSATLGVAEAGPSVEFMQQVFGWDVVGVEGSRTRLNTGGADGHVIDVVAKPGGGYGRLGPGSIHHIAFRVADDAAQQEWRARLLKAGISVTLVQNRHYFKSIYFREPGGVLFEIATDVPGFLIDEDFSTLGQSLKLPPWFEPRRAEIERSLPPLD